MILLCGIPTEGPLALLRAEVEKLGYPYVLFNQRHFADSGIDLRLSSGKVAGTISTAGRTYRLEDISGIFVRLMDERELPEILEEPEDSPLKRHCRKLHESLVEWCEISPGRVVNRVAPMGSNFSKPYQAQLICRQGFLTPETLITNDPLLAREFYQTRTKVIYKSISGVRSIVQLMKPEDLDRLDSLRWCPTQFQEFVEGENVRVHTIGQTNVFATRIVAEATDYRYSRAGQDRDTELQPWSIPDELAERCLRLARSLGLAFAGIDLKITREDEVFCFEVNPCPAFSYYESYTGQPIARALAEYLVGQ